MSITYEEFEKFSDEEKERILRDLANKYTRDGKPYFPAIATALKGSVIAVADLYNRLIEKKHTGKVSKSDEAEEQEQENLNKQEDSNEQDALDKQEDSINQDTSNKQYKAKKRGRKPKILKEENIGNSLTDKEQTETAESNEEIEEVEKIDISQKNNYELTISSVFSGYEAAERFSAISKSFYKAGKYSVELKIKEL